MSPSPSPRLEESLRADPSGLAARALLGWMDRQQALKFLMEDCLFNPPPTLAIAQEIWESRKAIVEDLPPEEPLPVRKLPLSAADLKAAQKFRGKHPNAPHVVDFVRLNPMDLVLHQLWISTAIANRYRDTVTPDKWLQTALLNPPSSDRLQSWREGDTIVFDLPHSEFFLDGPTPPYGHLRVAEAEAFVTVSFHADRPLLLRGYHRTFACARFARETVNAPHGVLFGVSNQLAAIGSEADEIRKMMEGPRPPRMADWFDERLFLPVTLRRRRYRMRVHCEVDEIADEEPQNAAGQTLSPEPAVLPPNRNAHQIHEDGVRHHQAGRIDDAILLYERALFLKPDHADAHNNLGVALAATGRFDDAAAHYERALVLKPDHADAHSNLGIVRLRQGRIDEAMACQKTALNLHRDHPVAHHELGNILKALGNFDDAMERYGRAIAARPGYAEAHYNRSEIKTFRQGDPDLVALEKLAGKDDLPAAERLFIHFALAKALDDTGDYARAFEHLRKGNDLKRRQIKYDEASFARLFERIAAVFDASLLDRFQGEGAHSAAPIFVLGMPRSGSSLIEQILAAHPQIHAAGELNALDAAIRTASQPTQFPEWVPALNGDTARRLAQSYLAGLPALAEGKVRTVDKMPGNFLSIGLIHMVLPNARIIHTTRDPVDTCLSCYSKIFPAQNFSYDLAELGRHYRRYDQLMAHWRSVLPPGAMLDVVYEDVVNDLEGQARRLIDYCGLPWDDRCVSFHKASRPVMTHSAVQVRKPLFRSSLQRWRNYEASLAPLLNQLSENTGKRSFSRVS